VISLAAAQRLDRAGVRWHPLPGDRFTVRTDLLMADVFTVADMVVEAREHSTGTVLAFNGTTEWALDSVQLDEALWLPREDQLRELLGGAFRSLARSTTGYHEVLVQIPGQPERVFGHTDPAEAYAQALLALVAATA
jgi:hypothetical protein